MSNLRSHRGWTFIFLVISAVKCHQEFENQKWTKEFAVEIEKADSTEAELIVSAHGFRMIRSIPALNVHHVFHDKACTASHRCKRHAQDLVDQLKRSPQVKRVQQLYVLEREKRAPIDKWVMDDFQRAREAIGEEDELEEKDKAYEKAVLARHDMLKFDYNDPLYKRQWQLDNYGQLVNAGLDLNLLPGWRKGYQGQGSRVTVVDDGVDTQHEDLKHAYDPYLSADLNDARDIHGNPRGPGKVINKQDGHGTSCAGEIAAMVDNNKCGCGVAHKVKLGGIRMLAGKVTDLMEAFGVLHMHNQTEIYSCSWGPSDSGKLMEMPHHYTGMALRISATQGRNGLGNIFTFASGNGGDRGDNCGPDGYVNSPYTFPIASVNIYGRTVFYGERCSAIIAAVPVGGMTASDSQVPPNEINAKVMTDAINNECRETFLGTSAATPLAAGCLSLVLQANRNLTWRDVQHIVAHSTRIPNPKEIVWQRNGAGIHVSHHFGFGLMDCSTAILNAQNWVNVGKRESCSAKIFKGHDKIFAGRSRRYTLFISDCKSGNSSVGSIEHVTIAMKVDHVMRGDLEIWFISPAGTVSRLLGQRQPDKSKSGINFVFLTRFLLGEAPKGKWTLEIRDSGNRKTKGRVRGAVKEVKMTIYGTEQPSAKMAGRKLSKAKRLSKEEVRKEFNRGRERALKAFPVHNDILQLKQEIVARGITKDLVRRVADLSTNNEVTKAEIKSLIELVEEKVKEYKEADVGRETNVLVEEEK